MKKESSNVMQALYNLLAEKFRLTFDDTELLETAFTHTSYANEHRLLKISHNERLEFLGDAVLQLVISEYLLVSINLSNLARERKNLVDVTEIPS